MYRDELQPKTPCNTLKPPEGGYSSKDIAKIIANKAGMPYCWDDIQERLATRKPLPFKLVD